MDDLTSRAIRWGIASTGTIAHQMAEALATVDDAEIVAVGSRTQASADEFARRHGIARSHGSYDALFADDDVDIVYIASPHSAHRDMTIAALDGGRHVLCEKAFAHNAAEAREMVEAARRNERFLMEAMWTWFIPAVEEVKRRVAAGEIGRVRLFDATFGIRRLDPDGRHRRADLAGGSLLDLGVYPLSWARLLLGEPSAVRALATITDEGVDDNLAGVVQFQSGALATFSSSLDVWTTLRAHVYGTDGRIDVDAPFHHPTSFTVRPTDGDPQRVEIPNRGLAHEAQHAMARLRAGALESDVVPLATSVSTMELMDDIRAQIGVVYPVER
jgi:predicted dehydrogenase